MESESDNRNCPESESDDGTSDSTALVAEKCCYEFCELLVLFMPRSFDKRKRWLTVTSAAEMSVTSAAEKFAYW